MNGGHSRFLTCVLAFSLATTQPVYAADNGGITGFLSNLWSNVQELFSGQTSTQTDKEEDYDLPFGYHEQTQTDTSDDQLLRELNDTASVSYNITFRGNGGRWGNDAQNKTLTLNSHNVSTVDNTQVVDLYDSSVVDSLQYWNDDQSSSTRASDADHVIFVGFSEASTGPIIRTRHYVPKSTTVELWAQWYYVEDPNATFTISYNAGIGSFRTSGSNSKVVTRTVKCGEFAPDMVTPYVSDASNPFAGWYLETEAGELPSSSDYIMPNATKVYRNMTFTARYAYDDSNEYEYYIKFMANGGTFSNGDQYRLVKISRDSPGVLPDEPTREGFKFNGWSQSSSDVSGLLGVFPNPYNGAPDAEDAKTHTADNPFIYYACWDNESTGVTRDVTVTLQPNGGTFGVLTDGWAIDGNGFCYQTTTIVNTGTVTVDTSTFPAVSREGYTFKGWSIDGGTTAYEYSTYQTSYSCAFTAMWVKNNSDHGDVDDHTDATNYTLTFDANGGKWSDGSTTFKLTVASGGAITFPETDPTRDAYTFAGWATSATATEASSFANLRVTGNAKIYAVWNLKDVGIPTQVQLVMGDGYYNNKSGTSTVVTDIGTPISQFYDKATRTGYTLKGFSVDPTSTDVVAKNSLVEEDMTLYAVWLAHSDDPDPETTVTYKVVFNANGGYYDNDVTHRTYSISVNQGDKISSIPTPKLDNATFLGYGSEINSTAVIDFTNLVPEADSTYYAVWNLSDTEYKVTFIAGDTYGGSKFQDNSQVREVMAKANEKVSQPEVPLETRNLTFSYWSETKAASWTGTSSVAYDFNQTIKKNTTLYAIYRSQNNSSKFRTVTFDYNGGKLRTKSSVSVDVLYGYPVEKPESPKRSGYSFKGWYTDTAGESDDKWDFDNAVTEDLELFAVWKDKSSKKTTSSNSTSNTASNSTQATTSTNQAQSNTPTLTDVGTTQRLAQGTTQAATTSGSTAGTGAERSIPRTGVGVNVVVPLALIGALGIIAIIIQKRRKKSDKLT